MSPATLDGGWFLDETMPSVGPEVTVEQVIPFVSPAAPFQLLISGLGIFEGAEGGTRDVLVAWVADSDGTLTQLHEALAALPHEDTHSVFTPHVTLAYLDLGAGEAVLDSCLTETPHLTVEIDHLEWRGADGTRAPLPLTGGPMPLMDPGGRESKAWDESAHPREPEGSAEGGRFTSGGGASTASGPAADPRASHRVTTVEEAFARLSEGQKVILAKPRMVSTLLDKLATEAAKARESGGKGLVINLCDVSVEGTNIFCAENVGYSRVQMPQLSGKPTPGSTADALPKNKKGEVDLGALFVSHLENTLGIDVTETTIQAKHLKASQNELDGEKVSGMMRAMELGQIRPAPIFVTSDDYVVDGHHRWAAKLGRDLRSNLDLDAPMPISQIHSTILEVLVQANLFATKMGIPPASMNPNKKTLKAWWTEQVQRLADRAVGKEWDESAHPREPAGSEGGGQFTEGGGGGGLTPELAKSFDERLRASDGQEISVGGGSVTSWSDLSGDQQHQTEEAWKEQAWDAELDYQVESWNDHVRPDIINGQLRENLDWVQESWDTFVAEGHPAAQALDPESLLEAIGQAVDEDKPRPDVSKLRWLDGDQAQTSAERWKGLVEYWRDDYRQARSDRAEELDEALETPDLSDDARESLTDSWDSKDDDEKLLTAKSMLGDSLESDSGPTNFTVHTPERWDPFGGENSPPGATATDYNRTRVAGLFLAAERTADLRMETGINVGTHQRRETFVREAHAMAATVWSAWKEKSGEGLGLSMQIAAQEHYGIESRSSSEDIRLAKSDADREIPGGFPALKAYVQAVAETSQYLLTRAGKETVDVYRAIMLPWDVVERADQQPIDFPTGSSDWDKANWYGPRVNLDLRPNGAASTTLLPGVANGWSGVGQLPPNPKRVVLRARVPASAVLSLPVYGQNEHEEEEVVVLGTDWKQVDAWINKAPTFATVPITPWREADHPRDADGKFT